MGPVALAAATTTRAGSVAVSSSESCNSSDGSENAAAAPVAAAAAADGTSSSGPKNGQQCSDQRDRNWKQIQHDNKRAILTCSSTKELALAVSLCVEPLDRVAELGAQLRDVSSTICQSLSSPSPSSASCCGGSGTGGGGTAVLVDVHRKYPKNTSSADRTKAMRRPGDEGNYNNRTNAVAKFIEIVTLDDWRSAFLRNAPPPAVCEANNENDSGGGGGDGGAGAGAGGSSSSSSSSSSSLSSPLPPGYDVFVLDVNSIVGNDLEWTSLSIAREFLSLFSDCKTVLVKSVALNQWAERLIHGQRWIASAGNYRFSENSAFQPVPPCVVAVVGVKEYRKTIPCTVRSGDAVLEVGCHLGTSTVLLHQQAAAAAAAAASGVSSSSSDNDDEDETSKGTGYCIGVDVGRKIIEGAKQRYPHLYFSVGDAWKTAELLRIQRDFQQQQPQQQQQQQNGNCNGTTCQQQQQQQLQQHKMGFDVIYVDVGGLSGSDGLMEALSLVSSLMHALEPRCIVIKSLCMQRLASTLVPFWRMAHGSATGTTGIK